MKKNYPELVVVAIMIGSIILAKIGVMQVHELLIACISGYFGYISQNDK